MRPLHAVLAAAGVLILVFFLVGSFLPDEWTREYRSEICAPPMTVFEAVNDPEALLAWSVFGEQEAEATVRGGPGTGARIEWSPDDPEEAGGGRLIIADSRPGERVDYRMMAGDRQIARAWIELAPGNDTRTITTLSVRPGVETIGGRWVGLLSRMQRDVLGLAEEEMGRLTEYVDGAC